MNMKTQHIEICGVQQKHFKGYFIAINTYIKKERFQINILTLHLKELGEQTKTEVS